MTDQHETQEDESNELKVVKIITDWMQRLPMMGNNGEGFIYRKIPVVVGESQPDYEIWWNNLTVGVVEIKCRTSDYESWMIDRDKLVMLRNKYQKMGIPAMLAFAHVEDGEVHQVCFADLRALVSGRILWTDATDAMMGTTNHGKEKRANPKKGYCIPRSLFWRLME